MPLVGVETIEIITCGRLHVADGGISCVAN